MIRNATLAAKGDAMKVDACQWCGEESCDCRERVKCDKAGTAGHHFCGVCEQTGKPRFACDCGRYHYYVTEKAAHY